MKVVIPKLTTQNVFSFIMFLFLSVAMLIPRASIAGTCTHWPLWYQISNDRYENVKKCLEEGEDPNAMNLGAPVFFNAIDHPKILELLIEKGADVNKPDYTGETLLMRSSKEGHLASAEILLKTGADVNKKSKYNVTAVYNAASNSHIDILKLLIDYGADLNVEVKDKRISTALMAAASNGDVESVKLLVLNGSDINRVSNDCWTALYCAARKGHKNVVEALTWNHAIANTLTVNDYTPISIASSWEYSDIVRLIYQKGIRAQEHPYKQCKVNVEHISIGKVIIDYSQWRYRRNELRDRLDILEDRLESRRKEYEGTTDRVKKISEDIARLQDRIRNLKDKRDRLLKSRHVIPEERKNGPYKSVEESINYIQRRIKDIEENIDYYLREKPVGYKATLGNLYEAHGKWKNELVSKQKELAQIPENLGIDKMLKNAEIAYASVTDDYLKARNQLWLANVELNYEENITGPKLEKLLVLQSEYDKAVMAYSDMQDSGTPLVTEIKNEHYHAVLWKPRDTIRTMDNTIEALSEQLRDLDRKRDEFKRQLLVAFDQANRTGEELVDDIYASMLSQFGVEAADFALDIMEEFVEKGPAGVVSATYKKALELAIFGLPEYYDATHQRPHKFIEKLNDKQPYGTFESIAKNLTSDNVDAAVNFYLMNHEKKELDELYDLLTKGSWYTSFLEKNDPDFHKRFMEGVVDEIKIKKHKIVDYAHGAEKKLHGLGLKTAAKEIGVNLVKGFAKGSAVSYVKKYLAEYFEGQGVRKYLKAQYDYQVAANAFMANGDVYWMTKDVHTALRGLRNKILRDYDPSVSMLVKKSGVWPFYEHYEPYEINITVLGLHGSAPEVTRYQSGKVEVVIGEQKANVDESRPGFFIVPVEKVSSIKSNREKGAVLEIRVLR